MDTNLNKVGFELNHQIYARLSLHPGNTPVVSNAVSVSTKPEELPVNKKQNENFASKFVNNNIKPIYQNVFGACCSFMLKNGFGDAAMRFIDNSGFDGPDPNIPDNNFLKVNNNYFRGAVPDNESYVKEFLYNNGVKTVVDLRMTSRKNQEKERELLAKYGIKYENIPMNPGKPPTDKEIKRFFEIIDKKESVYVHCMHGKDRTGIMTALYQISQGDTDFNHVFAQMEKRGHKSWKFPALKEFLNEYVQNFRPPKSLSQQAA